MPTRFGPVDLSAKVSGDRLQVTYSLRPHSPSTISHQPSTTLHVPPVTDLKSITLNGKPIPWDGKAKSVVIR